MRNLIAVLMFSMLVAGALPAQSPTAANAAEKHYVVEYYYQVMWGNQDEFLRLFKKNHYPLLKKQIEMGRMVSVSMTSPTYHMPEEARWDYRVTIVFRDAAAATAPFDEESLKKQLYPDQATFVKEEQRRFEILLAHWDLPVTRVNP